MEKYQFPCQPLADPNAVVTGTGYRFTLLGDHVIRCEWAQDGVFEDHGSTFAVNRHLPVPQHRVLDTPKSLEIVTSSIRLTYDKKRFSPGGLSAVFATKCTLWGAQWRYGMANEANLGGTARTLDEVNGRCDVDSGILSRAGYAFIDDSDSMLFDSHGFVLPRPPGDRIDGYLFHYGVRFKEAMKAFYTISGNQPRLPRWTLGNWWSRYYKYTAEEYLQLMDRFTNNDIPLSVAVIDMDWHLVHGKDIKHSGWTGYTWNNKLFSDPSAFATALRLRKLKMALNDHPHGGIGSHEDAYEEMADALAMDVQYQPSIAFNPTCPHFMHAYLNVLHRQLERKGCDFWWIDWQQGQISAIPGLDPLWLLNHFHFLDHQEQNKGRGLIFSRYAGPGSHRYPIGFSGDSITSWASLAFQPEFTATASNIGFGWWSHDIGGHMHGSRDDELTVRWVQFGTFSPILRLHSSHSEWTSKEPWLYGPESYKIIRNFMQFRHRMVPFLYSMHCQGVELQEPLIQPMYWAYPARDQAYTVPNQYYFGQHLVVAPVVESCNSTTGLAPTRVWLPPGTYLDVLTGTVYTGNRHMLLYRSLQHIPVLAREGAVIPLDGAEVPGNGCRNPNTLELLVIIGQDGDFTLVEDPHDDDNLQQSTEQHPAPPEENKPLRRTPIRYHQATGRLSANLQGKSWSFRFLGLTAIPPALHVSIGGQDIPHAQVSVTTYPDIPSLVVQLSSTADRHNDGQVIIDLGPNPQITFPNHLPRIKDLLMHYQCAFKAKDDIWSIVSQDRPVAVKIAALAGLELDKTLTGPIVELLAADERGEFFGGKVDAVVLN